MSTIQTAEYVIQTRDYRGACDQIRVTIVSDGDQAAMAWDGGYLPVQWIRGDGDDRLATPSDWEDVDSWFADPREALRASVDPYFWAPTPGEPIWANDAAILATVASVEDITRTVWVTADTAPGVTERTDPDGSVRFTAPDGSAIVCSDDDSGIGEPLPVGYLWTEYDTEGYPSETAYGPESELASALAGWLSTAGRE